MQKTEGELTTNDGLRLYTVNWMPDNTPNTIVIIVHGIAEHILRYAHVAQKLTEQGYGVFGLDHRGHGRSEGIQVYFESYDQPVNDLKQYFDTIKGQYPDHKLFVYGHSMGSLISGLFLLKYQDLVDGWICTGTTVNLDSLVPKFVISAGSALARLAPKAKLIPLSSKAISTAPEVVRNYDNDPFVYRQPVRLQMVAEMIERSAYLRENASKLTLPVLIAHGSEDTITPVSGSNYLYSHIKSKDKTLKVYDRFFHEIHNEREKDLFFSDLLGWLEAHAQGTPQSSGDMKQA